MSKVFLHLIVATVLIISQSVFVKLAIAQPPARVSTTNAPLAKTNAPLTNTDAPPASDEEPSKPCVLLHNDNVLFGTASQQGEFVVISRGPNNEMRLPRKDVACWASSIRDLYQYRLDHRTSGELAAHIKDAGWCIRYDLPDLAEQEIRSIRAIDANHQAASRLERQLQRAMSPPAPQVDSLIVQPVGFHDAQPVLSSVGPTALRDFAINVQPMLLNRCGRCHSHTSDRRWTLNTPHGGMRASSRMTHENLAKALPFIDRRQPAQSELLIKALTAHGGAPAALDSRLGKAIRAFEYWLLSLAATPEANQKDHSPPKVSPLPGRPPESVQPENAQSMSLESWLNRRPAQPDTPARLPQVANPHDPDLFNRRFHPE